MEKAAWKPFKNVTTNFLGNHKQTTMVIWWMILYHHTKLWGCNMSLEGHFLDSHLDFLPENLGAVSDNHGE